MNLYATLGALKAETGKTASGDDAVLLRALERASREIDDACRRRFYALTATRYYAGPRPCSANAWGEHLWIDDLAAVTSVAVDDDGDGTYELTLSADTDYWVHPPNRLTHEPIQRLDVVSVGSPQIGQWPDRERAVKVVGTWGYSAETEASGTLGATITDATGTSVTMSSGHGLTGGETIVVDSEHLYVLTVATNALTVVRGVNGTTAAAHSSGAAVTRRRFPRPIEQAAVIRAADIWRGVQTGYGQVAAGELGGFASNPSYAQFRGLLGPYLVPAVV